MLNIICGLKFLKRNVKYYLWIIKFVRAFGMVESIKVETTWDALD